MAKKKSTRKARPIDAEAFLGTLSQRLNTVKGLRAGTVLFRLTGDAVGDFCLDCSPDSVNVVKSDAVQKRHLVEIAGDARRIRAIVNGKKDARKQFLAGGLRIRGDLRYFSDMALELGILKEPL